MSDIIDSLRGLHDYVPIGSGQLEIQVAMLSAADEIEHLRAEVERLRKDAERYRWIRTNNKVGGKCTIELECDPPELCTCEVGHKPHELDEAIDKRIAASEKSSGGELLPKHL